MQLTTFPEALFWARLLRGPPKRSSQIPRNLSGRMRMQRSDLARTDSTADSTIIIEICEPTTYDIRPDSRATSIINIQSSPSLSSVSCYSVDSASFPATPSQPPSHTILTDMEMGFGSVSHIADGHTISKTFLLEDTTTLDNRHTQAPTFVETSAFRISKPPPQRELDLGCSNSASAHSCDGSVQDISFENRRPISYMIVKADDVDWHFPPAFQVPDEHNPGLGLAVTIPRLSALQAALPLRIVKRNVTPLTLGALPPALSAAESPCGPSFVYTKQFKDGPANGRIDQTLTSTPVFFLKEGCDTLPKLPTGNIVVFGFSGMTENRGNTGVANESDLVSQVNLVEANDDVMACQIQSRNIFSNRARDDEVASLSSVLPLQICNGDSFPPTPALYTSSLHYSHLHSGHHMPNSAPPSPCSSVSSCGGISQQHSKSMVDLIALLDAEFDQKIDDNGIFNMLIKRDVHDTLGYSHIVGACWDEEEHWSDVLSIDSYAI
jgi:hypothetical protein